jgi:hypothetical protein
MKRHGRWLLVLAVLFAALLVPARAGADDDDDVRRAAKCTRSSEATLRLRPDDDTIRVEFEIDTGRSGARWTVILLHERRIVFRGTLRTARSGGSLRLRRNVPDWFGADSIVVRATGPRAEICRISATV